MPRGSAKRTSLSPEEAKDLAVRVVRFKKERGLLPSISPIDPWEKRMAEVAAAFVRFKDESRYRVISITAPKVRASSGRSNAPSVRTRAAPAV